MNRLYLVLFVFLLVACGEKPKKTMFYTQGNCPDCEAIIVETLSALGGVDSVAWNHETGFTLVKFRPDRIKPDAMQEVLSKKGFATQYFTADPEAAALLPACCREGKPAPPEHEQLSIPSR